MRAILFACLLPLAACAAPSPTYEAGVVPEDFSIDATILLGPGRAEGPVVQERRGRFVVFPDGALHAGTVERGAATSLPPLRRVLDRRSMRGLWALVTERGLLEGQTVVGTTPEAGPGELVYFIVMTGEDRRWAVLAACETDEPPDAATVVLLRHLAALAWQTDEPADRVTVVPRRYDFGPDPYAPFRRP